MKKLIFVFCLAFYFFQSNANNLNISTGKISVNKTKAGNDNRFIGKINDFYLFSSSNPKSIGGNKFYINDFPTLFLTDEKANIKAQVDLLELYGNDKSSSKTFEDIFVFSNKVLILYNETNKKENTIKFYLQELNNKTFKPQNSAIEIYNGLHIEYVGGNIILTSYINYNISPDSSKLVVSTFISCPFFMTKPFKSKYNKNSIDITNNFAKSIIFDSQLTLIKETIFKPILNDNENIRVIDVMVSNTSDLYYLAEYYKIENPNKLVLYLDNNSNQKTLRIYAMNKNWASFDLKTKTDINLYNLSIKSFNNNIIISSHYGIEENGYGGKKINILGSSTSCLDENLTLIYQNNFSFTDKVLSNLDEVSSLKKDNYIKYLVNYIKEDGGQILATFTSEFSLIISSLDKSGNLEWQRIIDRKMGSAFTMNILLLETGSFYDKENDKTYVFYPHGYKGSKVSYSVIDRKGNIETEELSLDINELYVVNGTQYNDEYIFTNRGGDIEFGIIKFH